MSGLSLGREAIADLLDQPQRLLASLDSVGQLEQARDQLLVKRINAARALDVSPWLDKHNRRVRQANMDAPPWLRGRLWSHFLTSEECAEFIKAGAAVLARLAGWEWAWSLRIALHASALYEANQQVVHPAYTEVSACATLREASTEAWQRLEQTTGCRSPFMHPWTVEDVQRILRTDRRCLLHAFGECSPLFAAAGQPRPEVVRGTKVEIETIRRSTESAAPAPASTPSRFPRWDLTRRILYLGDDVVKQFTRQAPLQFALLNAFEAANWPAEGIAAPSTFGPSRVKDTLAALNHAVVPSGLRFSPTSGGAWIVWQVDLV
jgi:hypothetical protein